MKDQAAAQAAAEDVSLKAATHTGELVGNLETSSQLVRNPGFQLVSN